MGIEHDEDAIDDIYDKHEEGINYVGGMGMFDTSAKEAMREYHEHMQTWKQSTELPEPNQTVICVVKGKPHIARYSHDKEKWFNDKNWNIQPTHWRPIGQFPV